MGITPLRYMFFFIFYFLKRILNYRNIFMESLGKNSVLKLTFNLSLMGVLFLHLATQLQSKQDCREEESYNSK